MKLKAPKVYLLIVLQKVNLLNYIRDPAPNPYTYGKQESWSFMSGRELYIQVVLLSTFITMRQLGTKITFVLIGRILIG
jgi:hypothetical protein